jgi:hypothetical protein
MILVVALALALSATTIHADPLPLLKPGGPGGACPHGYTSSGAHCLPSVGAQETIVKPANGSCPLGWMASDDYCLKSGSRR